MTSSEWDWWRIAEISGVWAAAIATFYASRTALKIASDQVRVKLLPTASLGWFMFHGGGTKDAIIIQVTNVGNREVVVRELAWHHFFLGKARAVHFPGHPNDQDKVPFKIGYSKSRSFYIDRQSSSGDWIDYFAKEICGGRNWLQRQIVLATLCVQVTTGDDQVFKNRVAKSLLQSLRKALREERVSGRNSCHLL